MEIIISLKYMSVILYNHFKTFYAPIYMEGIVEQQLKKLHELYEKTKKAVHFYNQADATTLEALKDPQNWKEYKELDYVNELGALY